MTEKQTTEKTEKEKVIDATQLWGALAIGVGGFAYGVYSLSPYASLGWPLLALVWYIAVPLVACVAGGETVVDCVAPSLEGVIKDLLECPLREALPMVKSCEQKKREKTEHERILDAEGIDREQILRDNIARWGAQYLAEKDKRAEERAKLRDAIEAIAQGEKPAARFETTSDKVKSALDAKAGGLAGVVGNQPVLSTGKVVAAKAAVDAIVTGKQQNTKDLNPNLANRLASIKANLGGVIGVMG